MPKVSVIVPNYNHANYLRQRIDSILNQTYQDFELILLDDCSIDNSVEILNEYKSHPKVKQFIFNEKNSGSTFKQWKKGVDISKCEYIWIAESDDVSSPIFLETLMKQAIENDGVGLLYTQSESIDKNGVPIGDGLIHTEGNNTYDWENDFVSSGERYVKKCLIDSNSIPNVSAVVLKREVLKHALEKPIELTVCGDWLVYIRVLLKSDIYYCAKKLNYHRWHSDNVRSLTGMYKVVKDFVTIQKELKQNFKLTDNQVSHNSKKLLNRFIYEVACKAKISIGDFWRMLYFMSGLNKYIFVEFVRMFFRDKLLLFRILHQKWLVGSR